MDNNSTAPALTIQLKGLTCPDCAGKIEKNICGLTTVASASVSVMTEDVKITMHNKNDSPSVFAEVRKIVKRIEPDVLVNIKGEPPEETSARSFIIIRLVVGITLAALGMLLPLNGFLKPFIMVAAYLVFGYDVILRSIKNITRGDIFDENFLMSVATIGAMALGEYFEAAAVMLFYQTGEFFQGMAVDRSRKSIQELMDIRPDYANIIKNGETKRVDPSDVSVGDIILVKPGEKIPLDGVVFEGNTLLDNSALTGESLPVAAAEGDSVLSGAINTSGMVKITVTADYQNSTVYRILEMTQEASAKKAPTEQFITAFARIYTPVVVILAVGLAIIPPILSGAWDFIPWVKRALIFLVVSCPCALVLSVPLGFFAGIGAAGRRGILVKGGNYLQALTRAEIIVFDKTGTLTEGVFSVTGVYCNNGTTVNELLSYQAYAENMSNHPIAKSIMDYCADKQVSVDTAAIQRYEEIPGKGIKVILADGKCIMAGNRALMAEQGISVTEHNETGTVIYTCVDSSLKGWLVISDKIKETSRTAIKELKTQGIRKTVMLTGDRQKVADAVGTEIGIDQVHAGLLPDQKVERLEQLLNDKRKKNGAVLFVGDGINDAPSLARADVGISMGGVGSDSAIEASDIVIMNDDPSKIADAIKISKATVSIVTQNIVFSLAVKAVVLVLAVFGIADMWLAVFADVGVSLLAVLNSIRVMYPRAGL